MKYLIYILFLYFIGALEFLGSISLLVGCHYLFLLIFLIEKIITNAQSIIIVHEMVFGRQGVVILV